MPITVVVARELRSLEEIAEARSVGPLFKEVELPGGTLTEKGARVARTEAFGCMVSATVGDHWGPCYFVPGARKRRGVVRKVWSAADTRRLFGEPEHPGSRSTT